ncbi:MAG: Polysaccharide biosynthesis protein [Firmicutes bacterium ADurb.Bin193]|nr:MAG: Polysaccharide biosynthesis protein [Firmicutes bacterium ADurb.Bin193]
MGAILSYMGIFLNTVISLVYTPFMLRMLGQSEFGLFSLVNSTIAYLTVLDFGLGNAMIRYTAKFRADGDKQKEQSMHGMFLVIYSLIGIVSFVLGLLLVLNINTLFSNTLTATELHTAKILMFIAIFNIAISFPLSLFSSIIRAYERFVFVQFIQIIRLMLNPLLVIGVLLLGYKSIGMIVVTTIISLAFNLIYCIYCFKVLKVRMNFRGFDKALIKEIASYSFFIFLSIIVDRIYWSTNQVILGAVCGTKEVAVYSLASTLTIMFVSISSVASSMMLPKLTKHVVNKEYDLINSEFIKVSRIQFIMATYIFLGFVFIGKSFIVLWAGHDYEMAYYISVLIMGGLVTGIAQNVGIGVLQARNLNKFRAVVQIGIAVLNITIAIPLAILYREIGPAIASFIAMFFGNFTVMSIYYQKKAGLDVVSLWKQLIKFIPTFMTISLIYFVFDYFCYTGSGITEIFIKGCAFSVLFIIGTYLFVLNSYEKEQVNHIISFVRRRK